MLHRQFGHFAGAYQKHILSFKGSEYFPPQFYSGITDGDCMVANAGFGADAFGHKKCSVQKAIDNNTGCLGL